MWPWFCKWKTLGLPIWHLELIISKIKQNYLKERDLAPLTHCVSDIHITGWLSPISHDIAINEQTYKWAETFLRKYSDALITNLENRFAKIPVVAAFSIFQLDELLKHEDSSFHSYGWTLQCELSNFFFPIISTKYWVNEVNGNK